jgi:ABC-type branched-subunit amino acid transport system ATPase component
MTPPLVEIAGVFKGFPGVQALSDVSLDLRAGEVHAIVGENGAGKSTLMNLLAGELQPDRGEIRMDGAPVRLPSPQAARARGVAVVFQELSLCPNLSIAENVGLVGLARARPCGRPTGLGPPLTPAAYCRASGCQRSTLWPPCGGCRSRRCRWSRSRAPSASTPAS